MKAPGKRAATPPGPVVFEPEFVDGLKKIFEEMIAFNRVLGLKITGLAPEQVTARIQMRHELVGHYSYNRLHGGVISAGLDAMGGLALMAAIGARHMDESPALRLERF
ncbi:MAG TPA: thioesterase family protein, partial [Burkholderiaceae bacterium]|nr:thioesterase family protein [Burkholderiaceae bacterium]